MTTARAFIDETWDFRGYDTKEFTHCFHNYPAMMIPQIARRLLDLYGVKNGRLLDPYCGTGTSLVEASLFGMHAVGCDINPLARLIASAKTSVFSTSKLDSILPEFYGPLFQQNLNDTVEIPDILSISYWFSNEVARQLADIRSRILFVDDEAVKGFLWVAFSETVRECSYTRNGEFKLLRMSDKRIASHNPNVFDVFHSKVARNRTGLDSYLSHRKDVEITVSTANTASSEKPQGKHEFDLVITSPPYGDSSTTVAYGQFSRLSADWIGFSDSKSVDRKAMGGTRKNGYDLNGSPVSHAVELIREVSPNRATEVESFYADLHASIRTVASMMSANAVICYVVGNRRVKNVVLPTDEFVIHEFSRYGFRHETTFVRNIPNKRMPSINSPSNIPGETAATMNHEHIVVCRRG